MGDASTADDLSGSVGRDPEGTRRRILAAALEEFSAKGISGARVDAIASRAQANKRMLYYYFGSKEGLFRAVLRQRLSESTERGTTRPPDVPAISASTLLTVDGRMAGSPEYVRLLMWEALERGDADEVEEEEGRREAFARGIAQVGADQRNGRLPADVDPAQLVLAQLALAVFPHAFPQLARLATGRATGDPEGDAARLAFLRWMGDRLSDPTAGGGEPPEPADPGG
ncbi:MAG: TetR/AcrR family transcriptional regulator [Acidimicrobiales bacterium]